MIIIKIYNHEIWCTVCGEDKRAWGGCGCSSLVKDLK